MTIVSSNCECGHEKRDHVFPLIGAQGYGKCKVCLCDRYVKNPARDQVAMAKAGQP